MKENEYENYYINIKWMTLVIPVLGVGIYEVFRYQIFTNSFSPLINSLILMMVAAVFGILFSNWLFKNIQDIHNTLFFEQQRLKVIFHHTSDGIIVIGEDLQILDINPAAEKLTGWTKKEVVGKITCEEMNGCNKCKEICWVSPNPEGCMGVDCGHRECWGKTCIEKQGSIPNIEMCLMGKNGKKINVAASYSYIPAMGQEKHQVKLVLRDVSEKKEFEKAIQNYATLEERYRLAREMHDGLAQDLAYLNIKTHTIQKNMEKKENYEAVIKDLAEIRQVTQETMEEVRQNIFNLKTVPMEETSCFRVWIEETLIYFGAANRLQTEFIYNFPDPLIFPTDVKVQLIRIIQEALTNIRKHSHASKVSIILTKSSQKVIIQIIDNGKGIDIQTLGMSAKDHFGLTIMQERSEIIGGNLKILSDKPCGTKVELTLPLTS